MKVPNILLYFGVVGAGITLGLSIGLDKPVFTLIAFFIYLIIIFEVYNF